MTKRIGDIAGGNYTEISSNGTVKQVGTATTFNDVIFSRVINPMGAGSPMGFKKFKDDGSSSTSGRILFDAAGKYGAFPVWTALTNALNAETVSFSAWILPNSSSYTFYPVWCAPAKVEFGIYGNKPYCKVNGGTAYQSSKQLDSGGWNFVTWSITATSVSFMVNGTGEDLTVPAYNITGANIVSYLGAYNASTLTFNGYISYCLMLNVVTSLAQHQEMYDRGLGTTALPTGITEATQVLIKLLFAEGTGTTIDNGSTLGAGQDVTLTGSPAWSTNGKPSTTYNRGVFLRTFEVPSLIPQYDDYAVEYNHGVDFSQLIYLHIHFSTDKIIPANAAIKFKIEYTSSDISWVDGVGAVNSSPIFSNTTVTTGTFTATSQIAAYSHILLDIVDVNLSALVGVSAVTLASLTRVSVASEFNGDVFLLQPISAHCAFDQQGSDTLYTK